MNDFNRGNDEVYVIVPNHLSAILCRLLGWPPPEPAEPEPPPPPPDPPPHDPEVYEEKRQKIIAEQRLRRIEADVKYLRMLAREAELFQRRENGDHDAA